MSRVDDINTIIDNLGAGGTYDEFEYALRDYGQRELISVLADRAAAGGGGSAALTLLGPFTVNFDEPNINSDIVDLGPLDEGLIIINAWMYGEETWAQDIGTPSVGGVYLVSVIGSPNIAYVAEYENVAGGVGGWSEPSAGPSTRVFKRVVTVPPDGTLGFEAYVGTDGDHFTSGVATIYLLAYTP